MAVFCVALFTLFKRDSPSFLNEALQGCLRNVMCKICISKNIAYRIYRIAKGLRIICKPKLASEWTSRKGKTGAISRERVCSTRVKCLLLECG